MEYQPVAYAPTVEIQQLYTVHYFHFEPDHRPIDEQHDFWELVYLDRNEVYACTPGSQLLLRQGEMVLHAPNVPHGIQGTGKSAANIGIISFRSACPLLHQFAQRVLTPDAAQRGLLRSILQEGYAAFGVQLDMSHSRAFHLLPEAPLGSVQMILLYLQQLLILMLRNTARPIPEEPRLDQADLMKVVAYMRENLSAELTFDDICHHSGMGATTLKAKFRGQYGVGVMAYYQQLRMEEARRMLREGTYNFTQVAEILGFSSVHYFSSCFKKTVGMTPTQYTHSIHPQMPV